MDMEKMKEIAGFLREQGYPVRMNEQFRAKAIASGRGEAVERIEAKRARMLAYAEFLERVVKVEECKLKVGDCIIVARGDLCGKHGRILGCDGTDENGEVRFKVEITGKLVNYIETLPSSYISREASVR